jgi:hypothetical protein
MTDLEAYRIVLSFEDRFASEKRSLEEYLRALLLCIEEAPSREPSLRELLFMVEDAFVREPRAFDEHWRALANEYRQKEEHSCQEILIMQIVDLRAMQEAKTLDNEMKHFGVSAPSGISWYNFDPFSYTERGFCSTVGDGMRSIETGELDEDGFELLDAVEDPKEVQGSWELLKKILWRGQLYE